MSLKSLWNRIIRNRQEPGIVALASALLGGQSVARTDEQIISALDCWMLACAVGADNGSIYGNGRPGLLNFERWLSISEKNWMPEAIAKLPGESRSSIVSALRRFVCTNSSKNMESLFEELKESRGENTIPFRVSELLRQAESPARLELIPRKSEIILALESGLDYAFDASDGTHYRLRTTSCNGRKGAAIFLETDAR